MTFSLFFGIERAPVRAAARIKGLVSQNLVSLEGLIKGPYETLKGFIRLLEAL